MSTSNQAQDPTARDLFLAEIGHDELEHRPANVQADLVEQARWRAAVLRSLAGEKRRPFGGRAPNYCGWWWCSEADRGPPWADLRLALKVLRDKGRDPKGLAGAEIAHAFVTVDWLVDQRPGLEDMAKSLSVPTAGTGEHLRQRWLAEVGVLLQQARGAAPDKPPGKAGPKVKNHALNNAIVQAEALGWGYEELAAILFLTGVIRGEWASVVDSVRHATTRTQLHLVPLITSRRNPRK